MPSLIGIRLCGVSGPLLQDHSQTSALDRLDQLLATNAVAQVDAGASWLAPCSPFGQLLAAAFDAAMTPAEWAAWTQPPAAPAVRFALLEAWRSEVLKPFARRFDLVLVGGELMGPPPPPTPPPDRRPIASKADAWQMFQAGNLLPGWPLYKVAEIVIRRPPGAGLFYVWGSDRGEAVNDASH